MPAAGARDGTGDRALRSDVIRTPISQFAPKVKHFHPFGLRCKDSKIFLTNAKLLFTICKIIVTFAQNYKCVNLQKRN